MIRPATLRLETFSEQDQAVLHACTSAGLLFTHVLFNLSGSPKLRAVSLYSTKPTYKDWKEYVYDCTGHKWIAVVRPPISDKSIQL